MNPREIFHAALAIDDPGRRSAYLDEVCGADGTHNVRLDFVYNNRNDVTEVDRYSDLAGTTLVGKTLYTIDDAGRVTAITHKNGSNTTIDSYSHTFDADNRVTQETSTLGPTRNYTYDATGQLTGDGTSTFTFDLNGNRTMSGYTTNTGNQLTSDGTWSYTYDNEGNVATKTSGSIRLRCRPAFPS
jgi:YD repeat-containing protein